MAYLKAVAVWCAIVLGAAVAVQAEHGGTLPSRRNILTFSGPVALPGTTLTAGSYVFELADPYDGDHIVVVRNRERTRTYYLGMTTRVSRPAGLPADRLVVFGEAQRGAPKPIVAWYPLNEADGFEFVYPAR